MEDTLLIAGREFTSRFFLGTGKFGNKAAMKEAIITSGSQLVTVALRRIDLDDTDENILSFIP